MIPIVLLVALAWQTPAQETAQARPDFAGTWMLDEAQSSTGAGGQGAGRGGGGARGGGIGLGAPAAALRITQTTETLTVEQRFEGGVATVTYALDGKRRANELLEGRGQATLTTFESRWDGDRLVTTIVRTVSNRSGTTSLRYRETIALSREGWLVIETELSSGPRPGGRRAVYRRSVDASR
jgi:hypothetical protein